MAISSKTRKTLWGRSGNRCAICKSVLIDSEDENDVNLNLGEECHIISSKPNGPRHLPNYDKDYDGYQNLILLCRNHHREIDERILSYPVAKLIAIKKAHEEWHDSKLKEKKKQLPKIGVLFKIENGKEIIDKVKGTDMYQFDYDELKSEQEIDFIGGFYEYLTDWADLLAMGSIGMTEEMKLGFKINADLKKLDELGFILFGGNRKARFQDGEGKDLGIFTIAVLTAKRKADKLNEASHIQVVFGDGKVNF